MDKTWEQHFLKEFKATCKNSSESELKQQKSNLNCDIQVHVVQLYNDPFNYNKLLLVITFCCVCYFR